MASKAKKKRKDRRQVGYLSGQCGGPPSRA